MILYGSGIIFFTFFYTSIVFNPYETAENLRKYGGYIPGIRPGESTALYIDNILTKLTTIGALYLALVCLMPEILNSQISNSILFRRYFNINSCNCCNGYSYSSSN